MSLVGMEGCCCVFVAQSTLAVASTTAVGLAEFSTIQFLVLPMEIVVFKITGGKLSTFF